MDKEKDNKSQEDKQNSQKDTHDTSLNHVPPLQKINGAQADTTSDLKSAQNIKVDQQFLQNDNQMVDPQLVSQQDHMYNGYQIDTSPQHGHSIQQNGYEQNGYSNGYSEAQYMNYQDPQQQMIYDQQQQQQQQQYSQNDLDLYQQQLQFNKTFSRASDKRPTNHYQQCQIEPVQHEDIEVQLENEQQQIPEHLQEEPPMDINADWWKTWENCNKLKIGQTFNLYKVPKIKEEVAESTIIGVIDQSGSMGDCFQWLATEWNNQIKAKHDNSKVCIFHNLAYEADELQLDPEMGTTDVEAGFTLLNNVLNKDQSDGCLTIIFVSDGQDNDQGTVFQRLDKLFYQIPRYRKINFLTIGVGEEFPTYLAMQLRQMYHTGENNIPPVFLVYNQQVHDNWKVTFNLVNQYLEHHDPITTDHSVQKFPWYTPNHHVYEKSWVFSIDDQVSSITLNGQHELQPVDNMTPQEVLEVGSTMISNIQLGNLKYGDSDVTYAQTCIALEILESLKSKFWGRGKKKKEEKAQLDALFDELHSLRKDPDLKNMSDKPEDEKDKSLALKLAVGAIGAGIGLYWLTGNYGDFAELMGGMDFTGEKCFGECGVCDKVAQCMGCDSCGQCCGDIFATGQECIGGCCKYFCQVMQYLGNFICGILGE